MSSILQKPPEGLKEGYIGNLGTRIAMTVIFSIGLYNSLELVVLILITFKRYTGLYFWSLLLSTVLGVIPHAVGFILTFHNIADKWVGIFISTVGWYFMVPGQSFVLYSRLHLVLHNPTFRRYILAIICIASIVLIIPVTILTFGSVYINNPAVDEGFNVMERFQVTYFCVQEILLSCLYIWKATDLLQMDPLKDSRRFKFKYELLTINLTIIAMDIVLLVMEFIDWYIIQTTLKTAIYSIKLKLEFGVLGRLVSFVKEKRSMSSSTEDGELPTFVNPSQVPANINHAAQSSRDAFQSHRIPRRVSISSFATSRRSARMSHISETAPDLPET